MRKPYTYICEEPIIMPVAFINYRRSDSAQAAQGLFAQLRARFGPSSVFLDTGVILPGAKWPDRLKNMLSEADVILSVIGPRWLTAANKYGKRRLDDPDDWVRHEIAKALSVGKPIIPLLVAGAEELPPPEAIPSDIWNLLNYQALKLRDEKWDRDLAELIEVLESQHKFIDNQTSVPMPTPGVNVSALTAKELEGHLAALVGWEPVESIVPRNYPKPRHELRKVFRFPSFEKAVEFMYFTVPTIVQHRHHPRWENQWQSVTVYLSTWDIGNRISIIDIKMAKELDKLYKQFS